MYYFLINTKDKTIIETKEITEDFKYCDYIICDISKFYFDTLKTIDSYKISNEYLYILRFTNTKIFIEDTERVLLGNIKYAQKSFFNKERKMYIDEYFLEKTNKKVDMDLVGYSYIRIYE